jgi:hypothetical protein
MEPSNAPRFWEDRWRIAAWILPAALVTAFAHLAGLPLAAKYRDAREQLENLRENTYEPAWLDSTRGALEKDVTALTAFHASREAALNRDSSVQATIDRIRGLAQKSGIEVVKTTPILGKADSLRLIKVRVEGFARYGGLLAFFTALKAGHPDLYLDEMLIRQGGDRSAGRLEAHLVVNAYDRRRDGPR